MPRDERFPPNRVIGQRKSPDHVNKDAWLTLKASGLRPPKGDERTQGGKEMSSRSQGLGAPLVEFSMTKAERNNLLPETPDNSLPWDPGLHGGYSDDDQRAPGFDREGNKLD